MKLQLEPVGKQDQTDRYPKSKLDHQPVPNFARRGLLKLACVTALSFGSSQSTIASTADETVKTIPQPKVPNDEEFIRRAYDMRRMAVDKGDQAYGAIIVRDSIVIGQSWSRVILDRDPTAHAEMAAIRDAARRLNSPGLSGSVMYSSSRPCPMCEAAAYWAGVDGMVYGQNLTRAGSPMLCR